MPDRPLPPRSSKISFRDEEAIPRKDGSLFVWTIIILLLIGFALGCWIFSFYVFNHPEKAFSYSVLSKLKKVEPLKRFELTAAPRGEFMTAKQLYERYSQMTNRELDRASDILLRNYIRNYKLTKDLVPYVIGSYNILDSYELTDKDIFPSGALALAQSTDNPQVLLEHVFTADQRDVPTLQRMLLTGLDLKLERSADLSALINVTRLSDGRLQFTAVPIMYGSYASSTGPGSFSLEPPVALHPEDSLPLLDEKAVAEANQKYSAYRLRAGLNTKSVANGEPPAKRPQASLVRVERPKLADGTELPSPTPAPAVATTEAKPTPTPEVKPAGPAVAGVAPASPSPTADGAPQLEPFLAPPPTAEAIATTSGGNWVTYDPGQMPRGRLVNVPDMSELADKGLAGERVYLQGDFVVTASGQNRAVLRANSVGAEAGLGQKGNTRVIVQFPTGSRPPTEGSTFARDSRRPFLITDVKKGADGQVNVFVREITKP